MLLNGTEVKKYFVDVDADADADVDADVDAVIISGPPS